MLPNSRFWQVPKIIYPNNIQKLYSRKQVQKLQEIYIFGPSMRKEPRRENTEMQNAKF